MGLNIIMALASLLHSSIGSLINETTVYCPGNEVEYKCYPTSPYFQWIFVLSAESETFAFANSPNGTVKTKQLKSINIRSVVTYNKAGIIESILSFVGHPDLTGATITCNGETAMYHLSTLLQPIIVLSIINESSCFEIKPIEDMLSAKLNYLVVVSTPYQNNIINWTTSNSVQCNFDIDTSFDFTVTNIDCPYTDPPAPSFNYSVRCPFFERSIDQISIEYRITEEGTMSALIRCANNIYLFMECGVDDMWQSNGSCSSNSPTFANTLTSVNEISNSFSKEKGSEGETPYLLVVILIPVITLILIFILLVVLLIVILKKRLRNKRKEERLDSFSNENEMAYQELSNAYRQGASAQAVQLSRYQAAISDEYSTINQVTSDPNYAVINKQEDLLQYDVVGQMYSIAPDDSNMAEVLQSSTRGELNNNLEMGDGNKEDYTIQTDNVTSNGVHQFSIIPEGNDSTHIPVADIQVNNQLKLK